MTVRVRMYLLGMAPLGTHTLHFESIDPRAHEIMTREHDWLVRRWDHCIRIQPLAAGQCRYSDTVDIEAGLLTPLVWLFARCFYAHRQWRWLGVARRTHSETLISD